MSGGAYNGNDDLEQTDRYVPLQSRTVPKKRNAEFNDLYSPCVMLKGVAFWSTIWEAW